MDLLIEERRGPVAVWTLNRPSAMNALNRALLDALAEVIARARAASDLRAIVLTGAGDRAFVAGADIAEMAPMDAAAAERFSAHGQAVFDALSALPMPSIAAVGGFALGGGCELAMATDILMAGPKARFGQPEVKLGVIPGFGGTQRLVRRVGRAVALDLCLTGRMVDAAEALRIGLASRVVDGDVLEAAVAVGNEIAQMGPLAVARCKRAIHEGADGALDAALSAERSLFGLCFATSDCKEGMAAFLGRRPAVFTGS
jgi:enoyl-CoA hydratase